MSTPVADTKIDCADSHRSSRADAKVVARAVECAAWKRIDSAAAWVLACAIVDDRVHRRARRGVALFAALDDHRAHRACSSAARSRRRRSRSDRRSRRARTPRSWRAPTTRSAPFCRSAARTVSPTSPSGARVLRRALAVGPCDRHAPSRSLGFRATCSGSSPTRSDRGATRGRRRVNWSRAGGRCCRCRVSPFMARGAVRLRGGLAFTADTATDAECASTVIRRASPSRPGPR